MKESKALCKQMQVLEKVSEYLNASRSVKKYKKPYMARLFYIFVKCLSMRDFTENMVQEKNNTE